MELSEKLARKFIALLRQEVGTEGLAEIARINRDPPRSVCASHDFLDANMVMQEAFEDVVGRSPDSDSEEDAKLWTDAWAQAKQIMALRYGVGANLPTSRGDFDELIANVLRVNRPRGGGLTPHDARFAWHKILDDFVAELRRTSPNFDEERFRKAAGWESV
jgi:hypothetical protein